MDAVDPTAVAPITEIGPRGDRPFTVTEIREHLAELRLAHPDNSVADDLINIFEAMLACHDCASPDQHDTGHQAVVLPLTPRR